MKKSLLIFFAFVAAVAAIRLPIGLEGGLANIGSIHKGKEKYESMAMADSIAENLYESKAMADPAPEFYESDYFPIINPDYFPIINPILLRLPYESQSMADSIPEIAYESKAMTDDEVKENEDIRDYLPKLEMYENQAMADPLAEKSYESKAMADSAAETYENEDMADYLPRGKPIRQRLLYESQSMADSISEVAYESKAMADDEAKDNDNDSAAETYENADMADYLPRGKPIRQRLPYESQFMANTIPEISYEKEAMVDSASEVLYETKDMVDSIPDVNIVPNILSLVRQTLSMPYEGQAMADSVPVNQLMTFYVHIPLSTEMILEHIQHLMQQFESQDMAEHIYEAKDMSDQPYESVDMVDKPEIASKFLETLATPKSKRFVADSVQYFFGR